MRSLWTSFLISLSAPSQENPQQNWLHLIRHDHLSRSHFIGQICIILIRPKYQGCLSRPQQLRLQSWCQYETNNKRHRQQQQPRNREVRLARDQRSNDRADFNCFAKPTNQRCCDTRREYKVADLVEKTPHSIRFKRFGDATTGGGGSCPQPSGRLFV